MEINKIILTLTFILFVFTKVDAQISEGGIPYSFNNELNDPVIYNLDINLNDLFVHESFYIDSAETDTAFIAQPVIGKTFEIDINPSTHGTWNNLENGDKIWRLQINSSAGVYMMLVFNEFYLPLGTTLFVYSQDKAELIGAFTSTNNNQYEKFTTAPIKSQSIVIEYYKPVNIVDNEKLRIHSIGLISESLNEIFTKSFGSTAGTCMINAKCSQYENWCNQRRSVALMIRILNNREIRFCTGSLQTNERRDGQPFFLTAFHCLDRDKDNSLDQSEKDAVHNWLFIFNYQSNDCNNPASEPTLMYSLSGASFINAHHKTDYALLRLNNKPPQNYNVYYNGWSNDNDDMTNTGVCIHHPAGDIKKISEWDKKFTLSVNFWKVKYTAGSTTGGSSGSPLFNSSGYVVGQLQGGDAACGNNGSDFFGRFDKSWHKYGLSWELNPNGIHSGSSQFYISMMSGDETCKDNWHFANANDLHNSNNVSFFNMQSIGTRQYDGVYNAKNSIIAESVIIQNGTTVVFEAGNTIVLEAGFEVESGSNFTALIGDCEKGCGNGFKKYSFNDDRVVTKISNNDIHNKQNFEKYSNTNKENQFIEVYPNPNEGHFYLYVSFDVKEIISINITNSIGKVVYETNELNNNNLINIEPYQGIYILNVILKDKILTKKIIIE